MKKHLFLVFVLFLTLSGQAQIRIRPKQGGHPNQSISLTVVAPRQQAFWLFVDDVLQNENPVRSICINKATVNESTQKISTVSLDNKGVAAIKQVVDDGFLIAFKGVKTEVKFLAFG